MLTIQRWRSLPRLAILANALLHTGVGKSHCVDQGLFRLEGYEAWFGVTNARFGGDGSDGCEAESDSEHFAHKQDLLV